MCLTWKYKKIYIKNYFLRTKPWIKDFEKKMRPNKLIEKATNNLKSTQTAKYFFNNKKKKLNQYDKLVKMAKNKYQKSVAK